MITPEEIRITCKKAIVLPDCPVKKEHAIAQRVWLEKKINEYIVRAKQDHAAINRS